MSRKTSNILQKTVGWIKRPRRSLRKNHKPSKRGFSIIVRRPAKVKKINIG